MTQLDSSAATLTKSANPIIKSPAPNQPSGQAKKPAGRFKRFLHEKKILRNYDLYLLLIPAILFFLIFLYLPMYGVQIAFKDFQASKGIWGSSWVGLKYFYKFFNSANFGRLLSNTLGISFFQLLLGFPLPIILALSVNELSNGRFKKLVQNITYAPHFLSVVVIVGMITTFFNAEKGIVNHILTLFGHDTINFMYEPGWFKPLYIGSSIWQNAGWDSIIYISALAGIDPALHEAAKIDGAGRMQRIWNVNLPGIMPTLITLLILNVGQLMNVGFEKAFLMLNDLNSPAGNIITTYSYQMGIQGAQYSFASAIGLFNSVVNCILLVAVNAISRRVSETSLF